MPRGGASCADAHWTPVMLSAGTGDRLIYSRFDVALRLTADRSQFRYNKITRAFQHSLFAKRERLDIAEIRKVFQHVSHFEDIAGTHLLGKLFEAILPIVSRG